MNTVDTSGRLGIIALSSCTEFGNLVDRHIREERTKAGIKCPDTYIIPIDEIRFSNGEGKTRLPQSVRGRDIFILCDPGNYSCTFDFFGITNHKSPDDHFQDLKRALSCICGKSKRSTVVIPRLYESRQDRRKGRESLDCALALKELESMGIQDIIAFDLHDSRVQNAVPLCSFENLYATHEMVSAFWSENEEIVMNNEDLIIISPDPGGMDRALFYSQVLDAEVAMFYKSRDLRRVVGGTNPIIKHDYLGPSLEGKNVLVVDDILATGDSVLSIANEIKKLGAAKVFVATTFAWFTKGVEKFDSLYNNKIIDRFYSTNLTYVSDSLKSAPWFREVDMSGFLAKAIDLLNRNDSLAPLIDATTGLRNKIREARKA